MAKLNEETAKAVADAETQDFTPFAGTFHVKLTDVDPDNEGPKGPYWVWEFEVVEEGDKLGRKLWNNTSLSKAALFSFQNVFDAFGVPYDTDTDDLIGKVCKAVCSIRTIQSGSKKGQPGQQVDRMLPADPDFKVPEGVAAAGAKGGDEDIFS